MSREHFTMSVNVDAFAFCLFEEEFQIFQVVAGNDDERAFSTVKGTVVGTGVP